MAKNSGFGLKEVSDFYLLPYTPVMMSSNGQGTSPWTSSDVLGIMAQAISPSTTSARQFTLHRITNGTSSTNIDLNLDINSVSFAETVTSREGYYFDSLKVSNIEVSSEQTYAKGGKGNPDLVGWDYAKEVTLTIENALLDMPTLNLMMGAAETLNFIGVGRTVIRNYNTGRDHLFTFIIPKCKVLIGATLTMEAEGDPSTFEMTIKAMTSLVDTGTRTSNGSLGSWSSKPDAIILFYANDPIE